MDLSSQTIDPQLCELVPVKMARHWQMLPISLQRGVLGAAIGDPTDDAAEDEIRRITGLSTIYVVSYAARYFPSTEPFLWAIGVMITPHPVPTASKRSVSPRLNNLQKRSSR